jgi:hypothetical protein
MPHYQMLASIPHNRHRQFRQSDGSHDSEWLFSTEGFSNDYSPLYHCHPPTVIIGVDTPCDLTPQLASEIMLQHRRFDGFNLRPEKDFLQSRQPVLVNDDSQVALAAPLANFSEVPAQDVAFTDVELKVLERDFDGESRRKNMEAYAALLLEKGRPGKARQVLLRVCNDSV